MFFERNGSLAWCLLGGLCAAGTLAAAGPAAAQSMPYLDYSNLYGFGGTISITRLPIKEPGGNFVYKDATIAVTADSNGALKAKVTKETDSPVLSETVQAGVYSRSDSSGSKFQISGPAPLGGGGEEKWTIVTVSGDPCGSPAVFYTGPLDQSPIYARLQAAGITDTNYNYGVIASGAVCNSYAANYLIGIAQIGSQIEVALFTTSAGKDQPTPVGSYIYNFVQP